MEFKVKESYLAVIMIFTIIYVMREVTKRKGMMLLENQSCLGEGNEDGQILKAETRMRLMLVVV